MQVLFTEKLNTPKTLFYKYTAFAKISKIVLRIHMKNVNLMQCLRWVVVDMFM